MEDIKKIRIETIQKAFEVLRIGNTAVRRAQEENRKLGIPNAYSLNGKIFFELPNGEITTKNPFFK